MKISDTLTNQKKELEFSDKVRIYLCGVTVYDQSHIGHARTIIVFDTLRRFLEANGTQVELIQNFTDVDDKIINRAKEQGESASGLSTKYIQTYFEDSDRLNINSNIWHFVTGDINQIYMIAKNSYMVTAIEDENEPGGFLHSLSLIHI